MKTIQLRRYEVIPEQYDEFVEWFTRAIPPVREQYGFTIEFAYENREQSEFIWAVSVEGDHERFGEINAVYSASPERAAAFEGVPVYTTAQHLDFVESVL